MHFLNVPNVPNIPWRFPYHRRRTTSQTTRLIGNCFKLNDFSCGQFNLGFPWFSYLSMQYICKCMGNSYSIRCYWFYTICCASK
jgi:hypothetical protein